MIHTVLVMGSMLGIGAWLTRNVRFNADTRSLFTSLILSVATPSLIFISFLQTPYEPGLDTQLWWTFLFSVGMYLFFIYFTKWMTRLVGISDQRANELAIIAVHGNTGYIGVPLSVVLLGAKGTLFAVAFDMGIGVSLWTISVMVLQKQGSFSLRALKPMLNAPLIATLIGGCFFMFNWKIPNNLLQLFQHLGALATPLALIYIGFFIPPLFKKRNSIAFFNLSIAIGIKLLVIPFITALILSYTNFQKEMTQAILLMSTMPTGAMIPILFEQYQADEELGASATIYATILSLLTVPAMFYIGNWMIDV